MKWTILILSTLLVGCAHDFPKDPLYITDLTNGVCAQYDLIDPVNLKWAPSRTPDGKVIELPLVAKGPCDRMVGWKNDDFDHVKNWSRAKIAAGK